MAGTVKVGRLKELLCYDMVSVKLCTGTGNICIEPILYLSMPEGELTQRGFTVTLDEKEQKADDFGELLKILSAAGAGEEEFNVSELANGLKSVEEYDELRDFDDISMERLLERYHNADEFEMVLPFDGTSLTDEQAAVAFSEAEQWSRKMCRNVYDGMPEEERAALPDFETLLNEITSECEEFRKNNAEKIEQTDGLAFFVDEFANGRARYKEPMSLWHIYSTVDHLFENAYTLDKFKRVSEIAQDFELDDIPELKAALIGVKETFSWHCTTSGRLVRLFRFKLTEGAKAWLLTHRNDYELGIFEDLALYDGKKLLFSSCTHEHFHNGEKKGE